MAEKRQHFVLLPMFMLRNMMGVTLGVIHRYDGIYLGGFGDPESKLFRRRYWGVLTEVGCEKFPPLFDQSEMVNYLR